ncbi:uncharacterized protein LOC126356264 [Schistocerca gregaria]|uniref:uncharacterized protein LOC126356264 n=1 Tax=Schistocerca gregaria TaxID=7010 RepID=UPI00211DB09F|nr:uncharacterized protein LOC126356264 [Schistocerca gregaria]XP_049863063.1 uncharacterized protein LOC126356264 [Schistocerca gregaria]
MLMSYLPFIANATSIIPEFVNVEICLELCIKEDTGEEMEHSTARNRRKRRVVLKEGAYISLPCPGVNASTAVMWKKDNKEIAQEINEETDLEKENPHIAIDSYGTLYISEAAENDSGRYTCFADKNKVQEITVNVITDTKEIIQYMLQHMTYLLFIFLLCSIFYCAGIFIACSNRHQFVKYTPLETELEN